MNMAPEIVALTIFSGISLLVFIMLFISKLPFIMEKMGEEDVREIFTDKIKDVEGKNILVVKKEERKLEWN